MRSKIKEWKNNMKEKALDLHFFKFLCQATFGTFTIRTNRHTALKNKESQILLTLHCRVF